MSDTSGQEPHAQLDGIRGQLRALTVTMAAAPSREEMEERLAEEKENSKRGRRTNARLGGALALIIAVIIGFFGYYLTDIRSAQRSNHRSAIVSYENVAVCTVNAARTATNETSANLNELRMQVDECISQLQNTPLPPPPVPKTKK